MSSCTKTRKGNLFDSSTITNGPVTGTVEKTCTSQNGFEKSISSFTSTIEPDSRDKIRENLEKNVDRTGSGGLFNGMASMLQNVFGAPPPRRPVHNGHNSPAAAVTQYSANLDNERTRTPASAVVVKDEEWPNPIYEKDVDIPDSFSKEDNKYDNVLKKQHTGGKSKGKSKRRQSATKKKSTTKKSSMKSSNKSSNKKKKTVVYRKTSTKKGLKK